jgi:hypothetical protein
MKTRKNLSLLRHSSGWSVQTSLLSENKRSVKNTKHFEFGLEIGAEDTTMYVCVLLLDCSAYHG